MQIETTDALLVEIERLRIALAQAERRAADLLEHNQRLVDVITGLSAKATAWKARAIAAQRAERTTSHALASALRGLLNDPYGCPMCDAGRLRNPEKTHWPECPYPIARAVLGEDG